jgi:hypothetical protein
MIVAAVGILGLALKGKVFSNRKIYKSEKYATSIPTNKRLISN